ncbi:melanocyte-stimulating hormone receptor-like [Stylophora pistillata]|uniref:melanocyte-stimulating hormone receptor-like n=1 Tax=Stylophora pistillata TaxID=50429 RepID=UPI000C0418A2|nr:melanocyte-stimulating hormone receptor-like [Stylophora pistillata]XP_022790492.1 melanocyte-stimulating hormone receptor-like [Stylophora pistillata]
MEGTAAMKNETFSCYHFISIDFAYADSSLGWYIFSCVLTVLFAVTASFANVLVLVAIVRTPSLHSPSNTLLSGLALADLGVGLLVHPLFLMLILGKITQNKSVFCEAGIAIEVIANALCIISLLTVTAVSLDRYLALRLHLRYKELITIKRVIIVLVIIWITGAHSGTLWLYKHDMVKWNVIVIIILCLMAALFSYFQIYRAVTRAIHSELIIKCSVDQNCEAMNMARFKSHTISTFLVYCLVMLCYLPYFCVIIVVILTGPSISKRFAYDMTAVGVFLNSSLNPLVYCWRLGDVRNAVRKTAKLMVPAQFKREDATVGPA